MAPRGRPRIYPDIQATWRENQRRWRQAQRVQRVQASGETAAALPVSPVPLTPTPTLPARRLPPRTCPACGQNVDWVDLGTAYRCGWSGCRCLWDG